MDITSDSANLQYIDELVQTDDFHLAIESGLLVFQFIDFENIEPLGYLHRYFNITKAHGDIKGRNKLPILHALNNGDWKIAYYLHQLNPHISRRVIKIAKFRAESPYVDKFNPDSILFMKILNVLDNFEIRNPQDYLVELITDLDNNSAIFFIIDKLHVKQIDLTQKLLRSFTAKGKCEIVTTLYNRIDREIDQIDTVVKIACREGHLDLLKFFSEQGLPVINVSNITIAGQNGHIEIFEYLINGNREVLLELEARDLDTKIFKTACRKGYLEIIKYLRNLDVLPNFLPEKLGKIAVLNGNAEILDYLIEWFPNNFSNIHYLCITATKANQISIIDYLYDKFVITKKNLNEIFLTAVTHNCFAIVRKVVEYGADITWKHYRAFLIARHLENLEIFNWLNEQDTDGMFRRVEMYV